MTCAILPRSYIVRTFQKPISVVVFALTAPVVMTADSFRLWPLSVIRILLPAEFLGFSLSAFTVANGMDSRGSFCTEDSCKLHVAVSVTKVFLHDRVVSPMKKTLTWRNNFFGTENRKGMYESMFRRLQKWKIKKNRLLHV